MLAVGKASPPSSERRAAAAPAAALRLQKGTPVLGLSEGYGSICSMNKKPTMLDNIKLSLSVEKWAIAELGIEKAYEDLWVRASCYLTNAQLQEMYEWYIEMVRVRQEAEEMRWQLQYGGVTNV